LEETFIFFRMKGFHLSKKELEALHAAHKNERNKRYAYRIHAVILLGTGYTLKKVKAVLFIDDETLRSYIERYQKEGIPSLIYDDYKGRMCRLSQAQIDQLRHELEATIHLTTNSIIDYVFNQFEIRYSITGMRDLLHRLDYVYKKPKLVPGNPDIHEQELFAKQYEEYMLKKPNDVEVLFADAVHPQHNTMAAYGWMKRGETRAIQTSSGRERLNLHGAMNAETLEVTIIESDTVDAESTIQLLEVIENKYPLASTIYVILDNARYHFSKKVKTFLEASRVKLIFLPSYSPNLNLIERLWKFFKKKVLYNQYYEKVDDFRKACIQFFSHLDQYHDDLRSIMAGGFEFFYT